jgi:predicted proteasome-type protease
MAATLVGLALCTINLFGQVKADPRTAVMVNYAQIDTIESTPQERYCSVVTLKGGKTITVLGDPAMVMTEIKYAQK